MEQLQLGYLVLAAAACGLLGYALRGWVDQRKANAKSLMLKEMSEDLKALESYKKDNSEAEAERMREAADAALLASLKERIAALQ